MRSCFPAPVLVLFNWSPIFPCILCSTSRHPPTQFNPSSVYSAACVDLDMNSFWKWSAFEDYLLFCLGFAVLCSAVTWLLLDSSVFVEMLGFSAVMFEAMLGLPQLLQNFHHRTTKGMRYGTVPGTSRSFPLTSHVGLSCCTMAPSHRTSAELRNTARKADSLIWYFNYNHEGNMNHILVYEIFKYISTIWVEKLILF